MLRELQHPAAVAAAFLVVGFRSVKCGRQTFHDVHGDQFCRVSAGQCRRLGQHGIVRALQLNGNPDPFVPDRPKVGRHTREGRFLAPCQVRVEGNANQKHPHDHGHRSDRSVDPPWVAEPFRPFVHLQIDQNAVQKNHNQRADPGQRLEPAARGKHSHAPGVAGALHKGDDGER